MPETVFATSFRTSPPAESGFSDVTDLIRVGMLRDIPSDNMPAYPCPRKAIVFLRRVTEGRTCGSPRVVRNTAPGSVCCFS